jgi:hypothetical protein
MIYIFQRDFPLSNGTVIKKGEAVFIDDPNAQNEIVEAVKSEKERLKPKKTKE